MLLLVFFEFFSLHICKTDVLHNCNADRDRCFLKEFFEKRNRSFYFYVVYSRIKVRVIFLGGKL